MQDEDFVNQIRDGDEQCFIELVNMYKKKIVNFCYSYTSDLYEAEDLSQEVFMKFYKSINKFKCECSISTYLYKIAISKCLDFKRKKSIKNMLTGRNYDKGKSYDLDEKIFVRQCIEKLPKELRIIVILFYYNDLKQSQIAEVMNLSQRSVEGKIYRAKQRLKAMLMKEEDYICKKNQMI